MMRSTLAFVLFLFTAQVSAQALPDFTRLVEEQGPSVVNVSTTQAARRSANPQVPGIEDDEINEFFRRFIPRQPGPGQGPGAGPAPRTPEARSLGSGFIATSDGYILTNAHVVEAADEINVRLTDKREFKAKVIGSDKRTDVAVIKIEATGLPAVKFGDPARLRVGEWVVAIGSPFGFENTVTAGIVSGKGRSLPQENLVPFIQTDVAINPGNSGGPLFNMRGEVVGMNSQIYSRTGGYMGLSFAIPIDLAMDIQNQLRSKGRVSRGRIGVVIQEVTKDMADSFGLKRPEGALVNSVEKGSPADKAGVEALDIIVKFDNKPVTASADLPRIVSSTRPGAQVGLQVWRKGAAKDLSITVGEIPEERVASRDSPRPRSAALAANRLGLVVSELSGEQKKELKISHGLVVDEVRPDARVEVRRGDVLLAIVSQGRVEELKSVAQLNKRLGELDKSSAVTLHVRRGETTLVLSVAGLADKG
ncbi:MAG: DegQ family serine endoprotease [Betaproteobacteria bacterium]|nr:DegQ family serine endoprotease [Betaproteobacteria bacterium]